MALTPGVWVGSWEIVTTIGVRAAGARQAGLALVERGGQLTVWELVGWPRIHSDITPRSTPVYGSFSSYRWFQIAHVTMLPRMQQAVAVARAEFAGTRYALADSNRFVAAALYHAGIWVTPQAELGLGWVPAFWPPHVHPRR